MTKEEADEKLHLPNMSNFVQKRSAILHFTSEDAQLFLRASVQVRKVLNSASVSILAHFNNCCAKNN